MGIRCDFRGHYLVDIAHNLYHFFRINDLKYMGVNLAV